MILSCSHTRQAAGLLVLVVALVAPVAGQPANGTTPANETNATGTGQAAGEAIPSSCSEIRENPAGNGGPDYRVVDGGCALALEDGEVLSNVYFRADGETIDIRARGSGWTIRNVAVTNHGRPDNPPFNLQVNSRDGVGLVSNVWVSDVPSNALFVHPKHAGTIRFERVTFVRIGEDGAYASRPGNPVDSPVGGMDGGGGVVGFDRAYVRDAGGRVGGYGLRLGSDGSYITNSTIVETTGPAAANTFAGGEHPRRNGRFDGMLLRNVDIVTDGVGIRLNNHQDRHKGRREWSSITYLQNVQIDAATELERNQAGGEDPVVRGDYGTNPDPTPPPGAPRSPERAASGIGGGTGMIGGPTGPGGGTIEAIRSLVVGIILVVVAIGVTLGIVLLALLERDSDGGGFP